MQILHPTSHHSKEAHPSPRRRGRPVHHDLQCPPQQPLQSNARTLLVRPPTVANLAFTTLPLTERNALVKSSMSSALSSQHKVAMRIELSVSLRKTVTSSASPGSKQELPRSPTVRCWVVNSDVAFFSSFTCRTTSPRTEALSFCTCPTFARKSQVYIKARIFPHVCIKYMSINYRYSIIWVRPAWKKPA